MSENGTLVLNNNGRAMAMGSFPSGPSHFTTESHQSEALARADEPAPPEMAGPEERPDEMAEPEPVTTTGKKKKPRVAEDGPQTRRWKKECRDYLNKRVSALKADVARGNPTLTDWQADVSARKLLAHEMWVSEGSIRSWLDEKKSVLPSVESRMLIAHRETGNPLPDTGSHAPTMEGEELKKFRAWFKDSGYTADQLGHPFRLPGQTVLGLLSNPRDSEQGIKNKFIAGTFYGLMSGKVKWTFPSAEVASRHKGVKRPESGINIQVTRQPPAPVAPTPTPATVPATVPAKVAAAPVAPVPAPVAPPSRPAQSAPPPVGAFDKKATAREWIATGKITSPEQLREAMDLLSSLD